MLEGGLWLVRSGLYVKKFFFPLIDLKTAAKICDYCRENKHVVFLNGTTRKCVQGQSVLFQVCCGN